MDGSPRARATIFQLARLCIEKGGDEGYGLVLQNILPLVGKMAGMTSQTCGRPAARRS